VKSLNEDDESKSHVNIDEKPIVPKTFEEIL